MTRPAPISNCQWHSHWGCKGGRVLPLTAKILLKIGKKRKKIRKNRGKKEKKSGRKGKNWEGSFTLPLLTDRAGYTTANCNCTLFSCRYACGSSKNKNKNMLMVYQAPGELEGQHLDDRKPMTKRLLKFHATFFKCCYTFWGFKITLIIF